MAWTAPRTWVAGETVTAALLNTHLRDNLKAIGDAWTSYTPVWTAATTNPVLGNGTMGGAWMQAGKLTLFRINITAGSTTTFGTGGMRLTLPATPTSNLWSFNLLLRDASVPARWSGVCVWSSSGYVELQVPATTAGNQDRSVTNTVPFTFANTDEIFVSGTYQAA